MNPSSLTEARPDLSGIRTIECVFPDANGVLRGKLLKVADCTSGRPLMAAQAILVQTITGDYATDVQAGDMDDDMRLAPDWRTFRRTPWMPDRALLIHDCERVDGTPIGLAPRSVLSRVLAAYAQRGLRPVVAPELEFYLFQATDSEVGGFQLPGNRDGSGAGFQSAYSVSSAHELGPFWAQLDRYIEALRLPADTWLHEMGPSQYEINLQHGSALQAADQVLLLKSAIREAAVRHGLRAVFMAKPIAGQPGSSMHLHQSLLDAGGSNVFSEPDGADSPLFHHYIAGLQNHLPDWSLLMAPFMNSWRRFERDTGAPTNLEWGVDNRTAGLRVPRAPAAARRVENRLPGSDANPYLAIAASLAAGLAGIEDATLPRPSIDDRSAYDAPSALPESPFEAVRRLESSVSARRQFGDHFVDAWCSVKHKELAHYLAEVSAWDRRHLARDV